MSVKYSMHIPVEMLGQSGCALKFPQGMVYVDPYLSNSVQELDSSDLVRLVPVTKRPQDVVDADWVLLTHDHIDHCDPQSLPLIATASPKARFIGPAKVLAKLAAWGIDSARLTLAKECWVELAPGLSVYTVPAAHPEITRDERGNLACVGYLLSYADHKIYLAGDTFARQEIIDVLNECGPVHTAFLPVNEHNFFRARRGILGNMSVREALQFAQEIGAKQVVAVHWDMFAINAVEPDEIRLVHQRMNPEFNLLLQPKLISLGEVEVSIIIRTLNEARYLDELLSAIEQQHIDGQNYEVILVDSGSTDDTLKIAARHGCRILHIGREQFSFGRSLNMGCEAAQGEILVITSGHCVPTDGYWLQRLCQPILGGHASYVYGRQIGGPESHFSEQRIFAKYFLEQNLVPQEGYFCNNANSALSRLAWERYRFNEEITGLEDMDLAQRLVDDGGKVAYVANAGVYHHHAESWVQIRRRFEREAIALQKIMPQVHVTQLDTLRYIAVSIFKDWKSAKQVTPKPKLLDIARYRWNQYWGSYKGNHQHRKLSHAEKEKYFFPE